MRREKRKKKRKEKKRKEKKRKEKKRKKPSKAIKVKIKVEKITASISIAGKTRVKDPQSGLLP